MVGVIASASVEVESGRAVLAVWLSGNAASSIRRVICVVTPEGEETLEAETHVVSVVGPRCNSVNYPDNFGAGKPVGSHTVVWFGCLDADEKRHVLARGSFRLPD